MILDPHLAPGTLTTYKKSEEKMIRQGSLLRALDVIAAVKHSSLPELQFGEQNVTEVREFVSADKDKDDDYLAPAGDLGCGGGGGCFAVAKR